MSKEELPECNEGPEASGKFDKAVRNVLSFGAYISPKIKV
jgi:hypothetical protein